MSRLTILFPLMALGCTESSLHSIDGNKGGDGPQIEVTPTSLDFGTLAEGDEAEVRSFTIRSVGNEDLTVDHIEISGQAASSFTVLTEDAENFLLPVGTEKIIEVSFVPFGANEQAAQAIVSSDAENSPKVPVALSGEGAIAELQITPDPLDFGRTYVGCDKDNLITFQNVGTDTLTVSDIQLAGDEFEIFTDSVSLPLVLEPDESVSFDMSFTPFLEGEADGVLTVTSDEPMGTRTASQLGEGSYAATYIDEWENPANSPSDIVFFVDQSGSMDTHSSNLANNFSSFISNLNNYSTDWQIAVVNDDNGCNRSGILTSSTSGYVNAFQQAIGSGGGLYTESLFTLAQSAIDKTDPGECNAGMMRPEALLHLIFVSDEQEQSGGSWSSYINAIVAKKGSADNVRVSAIVINNNSSCASESNYYGGRYLDAANGTDGITLEICGSWATSSNLELLAEASVIQNTYELSNEAIEETIVVTVNGSVVNSGRYHYEAGSNSVVFDNNPPEEGDTISIEYAAPASCD